MLPIKSYVSLLCSMENSGPLTFFVNGSKETITNAHPTTLLVDYLRAKGLTGTKIGCGEGGCGACTVAISSALPDGTWGPPIAVNSCLRYVAPPVRDIPLVTPTCLVRYLHSTHGQRVTTVEGVGTSSCLHPIQDRLAKVNLNAYSCSPHTHP